MLGTDDDDDLFTLTKGHFSLVTAFFYVCLILPIKAVIWLVEAVRDQSSE